MSDPLLIRGVICYSWPSGYDNSAGRLLAVIAPKRPPHYLRRSMYRLVASLLVALALFVSPLMMANGAGMAMPHAAALSQVDGHCAGEEIPADEDGAPAKASCASACAACLSLGASSSAAVPMGPLVIAATGSQVLSGIHPEGETPPPRILPEI